MQLVFIFILTKIIYLDLTIIMRANNTTVLILEPRHWVGGYLLFVILHNYYVKKRVEIYLLNYVIM